MSVPGGARRPSLVVLSLERRTEVRRREQLLVDLLAERAPCPDVLYVEPPVDVLHALRRRDLGALRPWRRLRADGAARPVGGQRRLVFRPRKWLPRVVDPWGDARLARQVVRVARRLGLADPLLWVNDVRYAPILDRVEWPSLYDVTDDWTQASQGRRARRRAVSGDAVLTARATAVVVCSPALAETRGRGRAVDLVPNAVDVGHFRAPRPRPPELGDGPAVVYVGTLHADRLDVELCVELAGALGDVPFVLVGPDALEPSDRRLLSTAGTVRIVGARPYDVVPAYLQHAAVVVVPHVVSPFTESLDPIKAYECVAVGRPAVATPVAGFRDLGAPVAVEPRERFVDRVLALLATELGEDTVPGELAEPPPGAVDWTVRADEIAAIVDRARSGRRRGEHASVRRG